mmetsp:Transcript_21216/g.40233  ORF Transcript_21216/g.40233 Transcript_21216/m.40233 type:complete len:208 (-) Transcript_21216:681-1304(-)
MQYRLVNQDPIQVDLRQAPRGLRDLLALEDSVLNMKREKVKETSKRKSREKSNNKKTLKKPKRILNAYNLFFQFHKQLIQEDIRLGRKAGFGNLTRDIANRWKQATPEDKAHFVHLYKLDKKRHERETQVWKEKKEQQEREEREIRTKELSNTQRDEEEEEIRDDEPLPFQWVLVDDNPYLADRVNIRRLAFNLGEECTEAFVRAFL